MAPELFNQPAIHSFASDFWALVCNSTEQYSYIFITKCFLLLQGCILYELSIGCQPFTHRNFPELARMVRSKRRSYDCSKIIYSPPTDSIRRTPISLDGRSNIFIFSISFESLL
jgi:serine/threonine protein kinase